MHRKRQLFCYSHAFIRQNERMISLPESLHVLEKGYEEKNKTRFDADYNTWKYAIRGKTIRDELDVRVIVSFDENAMLIITVMHIEGLQESYERDKKRYIYLGGLRISHSPYKCTYEKNFR